MPPDLSQFAPEIGVAEDLGANIRRIVAPNPSPMTYRGTNTYLLGKGDLAVIDPGPDNQAHLAAILRAVGPHQRISHILVTHAHVDHSPSAAALSRPSGPTASTASSPQTRSPWRRKWSARYRP